MSKQDTHFFNVFSLVIGLLMAIAICLFALARVVGSHTQERQVLTEADYAKNVAVRLALPSKEAVAGQDNSALTIKAPSTARNIRRVRALPGNARGDRLSCGGRR